MFDSRTGLNTRLKAKNEKRLKAFERMSMSTSRQQERDTQISSATAKSYHNSHAVELANRYESLAFELVHGNLLGLLPPVPANALDVGCGSGRDAFWLAQTGFDVVAVEPAIQLLNIAKKLHPHERIHWIEDKLPTLARLESAVGSFDFILASAVLMFLKPSQRGISISRLSNLLKPGGLMVASVSLGGDEPNRGLHSISSSQLLELIELNGLVTVFQEYSDDHLGRQEIKWFTIAAKKDPDR